jgi:hypothetical protein
MFLLSPGLQFNCSYEGVREASPPGPEVLPGPGGGGDPKVGTTVQGMAVYDSVLFHSANPQPPPSFSSGQQVFVEVDRPSEGRGGLEFGRGACGRLVGHPAG